MVLLLLVSLGASFQYMPEAGKLVAAGVAAAGLLLLLATYDAARFGWAIRTLGALVFCAYALYLVAEIKEGGSFHPFEPRSVPSPRNALLGLIVFGIPGLIIALRPTRGRSLLEIVGGRFSGSQYAEANMAGNGMWDAPDIVPTITYADLPRAIEWLHRVLGFREREEARLSWPGGGMTWFEVGNSLFHISTPEEVWRRKPDTPGLAMKVYVDDIDEHFARAKAEGARIVSAPEDGFWGGRIYRVVDHEGHQWEISQRGRDLAADLWQLPPGVTRGVPK